MKRALQLALLCALTASAAGAQGEITLPLVEPREFGLLVRAEVKGPKTAARTVLFIVDTGASYTHLDARFLDLPRSARTLPVTTGAGETKLRVLEPVKLTISGVESPKSSRTFDIETLEINLSALRKHCGCPVAGALGLDVLSRFGSFTVDFAPTATIPPSPPQRLRLTYQRASTP